MFETLYGDLSLLQPMLKVILAMTGRTKADEYRCWIAYIMMFVGCMQIDRIAFPCPLRCTFFPLPDLAKLTLFPCFLLTLPG